MALRIFISQPMRDIPRHEIDETRQKCIQVIERKYGGRAEIIPAPYEYCPTNLNSLQVLATSIFLMSAADVVVFAPNWAHYRGCVIEHKCAKSYGYLYINVTEDDFKELEEEAKEDEYEFGY